MNLQLLSETFESYSVTTLKEESGKAWLLAKDLAGPTSLNQVTIRRHIQDLEPYDKVVHTVNTPGGPQKMTFVSESGALQIIIQSHKPEAKRLRKWVCDLAVRYAKGELVEAASENHLTRNDLAQFGQTLAASLAAGLALALGPRGRRIHSDPPLTSAGRTRMQKGGFLLSTAFLQAETGNTQHFAGLANGLTTRCLNYVAKFREKQKSQECFHRFMDGSRRVVYIHATILKIVHRNEWKNGDPDPLACSLLGDATRGPLRALPGGKDSVPSNA